LTLQSVEVQCPPGCRVARAEVKPSTQPPQLAATVLSADEKPVLRLTVPPIGKIETQPLLQVHISIDVADWDFAYTYVNFVSALRLICHMLNEKMKFKIY
jgi:hypothetical protein